MSQSSITRRQAAVTFTAALATIAVSSPSAAQVRSTSPGRNIEVVRGFMRDVFNAHEPSATERYCTSDYVFEGGSLGRLEGPRGYGDGLAFLFAALPDVRASEQAFLEGGDLAAVRYVVEGTHRGPMWNIAPTGRSVRWETNIFYQIRGDRMAHQWAIEDWAGVFQQLGVFQPPYAG